MKGSPKPTAPPVHPLVAVAFAVLAAGGIAWLWIGEWRLMVTAAVLALVLVIAAGVRS